MDDSRGQKQTPQSETKNYLLLIVIAVVRVLNFLSDSPIPVLTG